MLAVRRNGAMGRFAGQGDRATAGRGAPMRARRRQDEQRMKARARAVMALWTRGLPTPAPSPRAVGKIASTHGRPCSCWLCTGTKDVPPKRERGFDCYD